MRRKRMFLIFAGLLVCAVFTFGISTLPSESAAPVKWTFQDDVPAGNPYFELSTNFSKNVYDTTGGRLKLDLQPLNAIVPYGEITSAVRNGVLDIAIMDVAGELGRFGPKAILLGASGGAAGLNPPEFLAWFYNGGGHKYLEKEYEKLGVVCIGLNSCGPAELFAHSNKPLTSVDDFKGLKFRTMGLWGNILTDLGASVITVPGGEIYQSMERGVIDAFEYCGPCIDYDMGFQEVAKYIGVPGIQSPLAARALLINKDSWNRLPDDIKSILRLLSKENTLSSVYELSQKDITAFKKFKEYGNKVFQVSPEMQEKIAKLALKYHEKYMADDPEYKQIFEEQKKFVNDYKDLKDELQIKVSIYDD